MIAARASPAQADEVETETADAYSYLAQGERRFDLRVNHLDTAEENLAILLPGYTRAFGNSLRMGVTASIVSGGGSTGFGDTFLAFQYDPSERITASPWIPDTLGFSASVRAPTGDAAQGRGTGSWLVSLGFGWAFQATRHLWLVPSAYYDESFEENSDAPPEKEIGFGASLVWLFANGNWVGYTPTLARDLENSEWATDHVVVWGKMFRSGFGLSLEYGQEDRIDPTAVRDDYTTLLNFYYQFGQTP